MFFPVHRLPVNNWASIVKFRDSLIDNNIVKSLLEYILILEYNLLYKTDNVTPVDRYILNRIFNNTFACTLYLYMVKKVRKDSKVKMIF